MDEQIVDLIRDQFKTVHDKMDMMHQTVNEKVDRITTAMADHTDEDKRYWAQIDAQQAQVSLMKWLFGGSGFTAAIAWFYHKFGGH